MQRMHGDYEIDDDRQRLDLARVHGWPAHTYWSPNISRERVERAARNSSLVVAAYRSGQQVGYLRVISDRATFAWLCDVYVEEAHRGRGLGRAMVRFALEHPEHTDIRKWLLGTHDAHGVYASLGFQVHPAPERLMQWRPIAAETP